jgi:RNA polymerase sigma factor (sigma-70 family)
LLQTALLHSSGEESPESKPAVDRKTFVAGVAARYGRQLRRFIASRLRRSSEAPDLAQEVYLRLLRVERHELIRNPEAYLLTIASHLIHEHSLRQATAPPIVDIDEVLADLHTAREQDPADRADSQQRMQTLERALLKLSPKAQAALLLHRRDGYSLEEIGAQLGVSRPMAKKYLAQALVHCRKWLDAGQSKEAP